MRISLFAVLILFLVFSSYSYSQMGYGTEVNVVVSIPSGKNAQVYNAGFGALAGFYYDIEDNVRLALTLGFLRMGVDNEGLNKALAEQGGSGSVSIDGSLIAIPVILSLRLITPGSNTKFYGLLEGGIFTYWSKANGTYFPGDGEVPIDKSEFRSEPGFTVGGGALIPLREDMNLDINIRYTFVQNSEYLNVGNNSITASQLLMFGVGLKWFFSL